MGERSIAISLSACLSVRVSVSLCVCLSASISLEPLDGSSRNFVRGSPVAVARSSSGGVATRYVLPVLWMTSRLAVMGRMTSIYSGIANFAIPGRSLMSMNVLFFTVTHSRLLSNYFWYS